MRQFGALADEVLERIDWNVLGTGLQHFSDMIADGKFQAGFKEFIDDVVAISQHLTALLKFIGWIPDADPNQCRRDRRRESRSRHGDRQSLAHRGDGPPRDAVCSRRRTGEGR